MFWKDKTADYTMAKLPGPRDIPELAGRDMVVNGKGNPDRVWQLRAVLRQVGKKEFFCRVFDAAQVLRANVDVKDWNSLNDHPELVLWEGYFNKETNQARRELFDQSKHAATQAR